MVSNGNEMDVDLCDFTEFFLADENTRVVAVLMEGLKNVPRFLKLAERAHELGKKIVVLKVGKSERGALTTMAHTARMAAPAKSTKRRFASTALSRRIRWRLSRQRAVGGAPAGAARGAAAVMTSSGAGASLMADKASNTASSSPIFPRKRRRAFPKGARRS